MNKKLLVLIATLFVSGCTPAQFNSIRSSLEDRPLICDPFDNGTSSNPQYGIEGSIYYLKSNQPRYTNVSDYLQFGTLVNAELFLSKLYVPTRAWTSGFVNEGTRIENNSGELLIEYFALHLESKIVLTDNDEEGDYQFGLLSDDGTVWEMQLSGSSTFTKIVDNDGVHPTRFANATQKVNMTRNSKIPMNLNYYQGPRQHIALIPMWRKFPTDPSKVQDPLHGVEGNETYFDSTYVPSLSQQGYQDLLSRGWRPLESGNYLLKSGTNKCVN